MKNRCRAYAIIPPTSLFPKATATECPQRAAAQLGCFYRLILDLWENQCYLFKPTAHQSSSIQISITRTNYHSTYKCASGASSKQAQAKDCQQSSDCRSDNAEKQLLPQRRLSIQKIVPCSTNPPIFSKH